MTENSNPRDEHTTPEAGHEQDAGRVWAEATGADSGAPGETTAAGGPEEHAGSGPTEAEAGAGEPSGTKGASDSTEIPTPSPSGTDGPAHERAVRTESWPCAAPAELELTLEAGRIEVALTDDAAAVDVELRVERGTEGGRAAGLSGLLNLLSEATSGSSGSFRVGGREFPFAGRNFTFGDRQFSIPGLGGGDFDLGGLLGNLPAEAVRSAEITWSEPARRLVVHSATTLPARIVPLLLTVRAPAGSRVTLRTGAGQITVSGRAGAASARAGAGDIALESVDGDLKLRTGSGSGTVRAVSGRTTAKTGSGSLELAVLGGPADIQSGSGDLRLGTVRADVLARAGSGDVTVENAEAGRLDLTTGSGNLRIGVHAGVAAELDLHSGSGRARSELEVSDTAPGGTGAGAVHVQGRTGSGDVLVTRALSPAGAAG